MSRVSEVVSAIEKARASGRFVKEIRVSYDGWHEIRRELMEGQCAAAVWAAVDKSSENEEEAHESPDWELGQIHGVSIRGVTSDVPFELLLAEFN